VATLELLSKVMGAIQTKDFSFDESAFFGVDASIATYAKTLLERLSTPQFDAPIVSRDRSPRAYRIEAIDEMIAVCEARREQFPQNEDILSQVKNALLALKSVQEMESFDEQVAELLGGGFKKIQQEMNDALRRKSETDQRGGRLLQTVMDYVVGDLTRMYQQIPEKNTAQKKFMVKILQKILTPEEKTEQAKMTKEQHIESELQNGVNDYLRALYKTDQGGFRQIFSREIMPKLDLAQQALFERLFNLVDDVQKINVMPNLSALERAVLIISLVEKYPDFSMDAEQASKIMVTIGADPNKITTNVIKFSQWLVKYKDQLDLYLKEKKGAENIKDLLQRCLNLLEFFKADELKAKEQEPPVQEFTQFMIDADKETVWVKDGKSIPLFSSRSSGMYKTLLDLYEEKELAPDKASQKRIAGRIAKLEKVLSDFIAKNVSKFAIDGVIPSDNKLLSYNLAEVNAIRKYLDENGQAESVALLDKLIEFLKTGNPDNLSAMAEELKLPSSVNKYARESILRYIGEQEILGNKKTAKKLHAILSGENPEATSEKTASVATMYSVDEIKELEKQCESAGYKPLSDLLIALHQLKEQRDDFMAGPRADFLIKFDADTWGEIVDTSTFDAALSAAEDFIGSAAGWMSEEDFAWIEGVFHYVEGAHGSFTGDIENQKQILLRFAASYENQELRTLFRVYIPFQHKVMTKNIVEALPDMPELYKAFMIADKSPENKEQAHFLKEGLKQALLNSPVPENDYALVKHGSDEIVRFEKMYTLFGGEQPFSKIAALLHDLHELMLRKQPEALIKTISEARALLQKIKTVQPEQAALLETMIRYTETAGTRFVAGLTDQKDQEFAQDVMDRVVYEGISLNKSIEPLRPTRSPPSLPGQKNASSLEAFEQFGETLKSQVAKAEQVQKEVEKNAAKSGKGKRPLPSKAPPKPPASDKRPLPPSPPAKGAVQREGPQRMVAPVSPKGKPR